ncbi:GPI-anchored protein LLG3-like [Lotus japonicus]|uniref:GPI-anchored protein LLG3-like n=1 Tax=Lotus japonicus TaxID=34305 RepID=UPI00258CCE99|nr:GPI-anchored protein LLG3-like [Lotus japonicus]
MGSNAFFSFILSVFLLATLASASTFISNDIFQSETSRGRTLLQADQKPCSVMFEYENYSVLTSQCKGPNYPARVCCEAFKQFACPYTEVINDLSTDCAASMFDWIYIYGKYPAGLFYKNCKEGKEGLDCRSVQPHHGHHRLGGHHRRGGHHG